MNRLIVAFTMFYLSLGIGCAQPKLDQALMAMRQQVLEHERLYAEASNRFADQFAALAAKKHEFHEYVIEVEADQWADEHTKDGVVTATTADFEAMIAKHDERLQTLKDSKKSCEDAVAGFRNMITRKVALAVAIYSEEAEAQKARESAQAVVESAINVLISAAGTAAVALPVAIP